MAFQNYVTVLFGLARTVGWLAHWKEMMVDQKTKLEDRQLYTGLPREFKELNKR